MLWKCYENGIKKCFRIVVYSWILLAKWLRWSPWEGDGRERERAMEHDMYITFIHEDFDVTNHWNTGTLDLWREPLFLFWQSYLFKPKTCLNMWCLIGNCGLDMMCSGTSWLCNLQFRDGLVETWQTWNVMTPYFGAIYDVLRTFVFPYIPITKMYQNISTCINMCQIWYYNSPTIRDSYGKSLILRLRLLIRNTYFGFRV